MISLAVLRGVIYYFCVKNIAELYTENKDTITYIGLAAFIWGFTSFYNENKYNIEC